LKDRIAADPSLAKPPRKARADKGTVIPRKKASSRSKGKHAEGGKKRKRDETDDEPESKSEEEPPCTKKARQRTKAAAIKRKLPPLARSRSTIPSTDDEE